MLDLREYFPYSEHFKNVFLGYQNTLYTFHCNVTKDLESNPNFFAVGRSGEKSMSWVVLSNATRKFSPPMGGFFLARAEG